MTISECVDIAADPAVVWAAVSDPTRTGSWSPENTGAKVDGRPGPLRAGDTFVGHNRRFGMRWVTRCRVLVADEQRRFQFVVEAIGRRTPRLSAPIATWTYDLVAVDGGTRVIETWDDDRKRWPDAVARVFDLVATRTTFHEHNLRNIRTSLANLKRDLEDGAAAA